MVCKGCARRSLILSIELWTQLRTYGMCNRQASRGAYSDGSTHVAASKQAQVQQPDVASLHITSVLTCLARWLRVAMGPEELVQLAHADAWKGYAVYRIQQKNFPRRPSAPYGEDDIPDEEDMRVLREQPVVLKTRFQCGEVQFLDLQKRSGGCRTMPKGLASSRRPQRLFGCHASPITGRGYSPQLLMNRSTLPNILPHHRLSIE